MPFGILYQISKYLYLRDLIFNIDCVVSEISQGFFYIKFYFLAWWCFFSNSRWWDGAGTPRCSFGQLCVDDCTTRAKVRIACKLIIYSSSSWKAADYNRIYIVLWHIRMRLVVVVCTYIPMYKSRGTGQQCCRILYQKHVSGISTQGQAEQRNIADLYVYEK